MLTAQLKAALVKPEAMRIPHSDGRRTTWLSAWGRHSPITLAANP